MFGEAKWQKSRLADLVDPACPISYGIVQPDSNGECTIPIVRPVDLNDDLYVRRNGLKCTTEDISNAYKRTILRGDELLLCVRGTTGHMGIATEELKGGNVTRGITPLYFKGGVNRFYVLGAFLSDEIQKYIRDNTIGSTLKGINMEKVRKIEIPLPPIELQNQYETIFKQADKSKFSRIKSRFIEMFFSGKYPMKKLKGYIEVLRGVSYKPADVSDILSETESVILRSNNIDNGQINFDDLVYVNSERVSDVQVLSAGDIVMCGSNGSKKLVGKAAMINETPENRTSFGAFCLGIRCYEDILHPKFLETYFQTSIYRDVIEFLGSGSNILNIKPDHINNLEIPIPDKSVQMEFVSIAEQADKSKYTCL